jgi:hypothetical protein
MHQYDLDLLAAITCCCDAPDLVAAPLLSRRWEL